MQEIADGVIYQDADRVLVILWNADRTFEGWLSAEDSLRFCPSEVAAPLNPVVQQALKSVANSWNSSDGISHGYGKDFAIDALRKLLEAGYVVNEPTLEAGAFAAGFKWDEVTQLRTYAAKLAQSGRFVTKGKAYRDEVVSIWERAASE